MLSGPMDNLDFSDIKGQLREGLEKLSLEELKTTAREACVTELDGTESKEDLIKLIISADTNATLEHKKRVKREKACFGCAKYATKILPGGDSNSDMTDGEKYLARRKKRMDELQKRDVK